ncbi:hypothetical protein F4678DRAFT_403462 [Xylaria arbuscula]|nr:hypothetical protein F4678DRAFT_403462 [Xylaria arbuscula]
MYSQTPPTNLPKISTLRQQLGYGDVDSGGYNAFVLDVRAFRKKFNTRKELAGSSLTDWKSSEHQGGLTEMANAYLETCGNRFWPNSPLAASGNKLRYSQDSAKIKSLMKQLFYRLNEQEVRNKKYKNKGKQVSNTGSVNERGHSPEEPIDVSSTEDDQGIPPKPFSSLMQPSLKSTHLNDYSFEPINSTRRSESKRNHAYVEDEENYDASQSPPRKAVKRRDAKRTPPISTSYSQAGKSTKAASLSVESSTKRKSPRSKQTLKMDGYATGQDYADAMAATEAPTTQAQDTDSLPKQAALSASRSGRVVNFLGVPRLSSRTKDEASPNDNSSSAQETPFGAPMSFDTIQDPLPQDTTLTSPASQELVVSRTRPGPEALPSKPDRSQEPTQKAQGDVPRPSKKRRVEFIYRIVTRNPHLSFRRWYPTRKLEETTSTQFMDELATRDDAKGLAFRVEVNEISIVEEIRRGNEFEFDQLRKLIKRAVKEELGSRELADSHPLACVIEVEPIMNDDATSIAQIDEEDFTF